MSSSNDHGHDDPFAPPTEPIACFCLHCGEEFDSWQMIFRPRPGDDQLEGAGDWCCPTPGCNGVGFRFDIFPADEEWLHLDDDADDDEDSDDPSDEPLEDDFYFESAVDGVLIDQFWREDPASLRPECAPDDLRIDTEGEEGHPLERMLPADELPAHLALQDDDIPF